MGVAHGLGAPHGLGVAHGLRIGGSGVAHPYGLHGRRDGPENRIIFVNRRLAIGLHDVKRGEVQVLADLYVLLAGGDGFLELLRRGNNGDVGCLAAGMLQTTPAGNARPRRALLQAPDIGAYHERLR